MESATRQLEAGLSSVRNGGPEKPIATRTNDRWKDAAVVITGGSGGIGRAVAKMAVMRGARVGVMGLPGKEIDEAITAIGGAAAGVGIDATEPGAVEGGLRELSGKLGGVDILVNCAGVGAFQPFTETSWEVIDRLMQVNYFATVRAVRAVLPAMVARRRGHIVNIASVAGRISPPFESAYAASKAAVVGLSEALSIEVAPFGVGVSLINPGAVATGFFATRGRAYGRSWPPLIPPERVARAVVRAVDRNLAEVFVPGWLRFTWIVKTLFPPTYRWGTRGEVARELSAHACASLGESCSSAAL